MSSRPRLASLAVCIVLGVVSAAHAQSTFDPPLLFSTGITGSAPGPNGVAAADLDGDHHVDLVVSHEAAGVVAILHNDGTGGFIPIATLAVGTSPGGVACGDLDGDGFVDVVVANRASNDVSVIRNLGALVFAPSAQHPVGADPRTVVLVDVDGDGRSDIVTPNDLGNDVSVLMNSGALGFAAAVSIPLGSAVGPRALAAADLDGDGRPDLAVANHGSASVSILMNDGAGGFVLAATLPTLSAFTTGISAGDMDGDGDADLVASSFLPANLAIYFNSGSGSFGAASLANAGVHLQDVELADLDFDGDLDVVAIDAASDTTRIAANDGTGALTMVSTMSSGALPADVIVTDTDGDFIGDLVVVNFLANAVAVMENALPGPVLGACGAGTLGADAGGPFDVLLIDGSNGGPARRIDVTQGSVIQLDVLLPPGSSGPAPFLIWGQIGTASAATVTTIPFPGIGDCCLQPFHLLPGSSGAFVLTNNFGADPAAQVPSFAAPWTQFLVSPPFQAALTFQGLTLDPSGSVRLTNGIILNVQ